MYLARRTYLLICRALRTIAVIATACLASLATAQSQAAVDFDLPAQPLELSLRQIADAQKLQMIYSRPDLSGVRAPAVKGKYTAAEAVSKATEGTGLAATFTRSDTVVIKPKPTEEKGGQAANPTLLAQAQSAERPAVTSQEQDRKAIHLEGIVVTAQKREERLQDVPASVSVVTADDIDRRRLVSSEDYLRGIPGVAQVGERIGQTIVIRGIETRPTAQNFFSGTTVATYFGEAPTTNTAGLSGGTNVDTKLVDIERVEVLRGPQGTAFGNSSLGGAVRTIPVAPRLDRFEGRGVAGYSVTSGTVDDNYTLQGVLNLPVLDNLLAVRLVGYAFDDSGIYQNVAESTPLVRANAERFGAQSFVKNDREVGATTFKGGRLAVLARPTQALRFTATYLDQKTETNGQAHATTGTYEQALFQVAPEHVIRGQGGGLFDTNIKLANALVEYDLRWADIVGTITRIKSGSRYVLPDFITIEPYSDFATGDHRETSGELRIVTKLDGAFDFIGGFFAERLKDDYDDHFRWHGSPLTNPYDTTTNLGDYFDHRELKQKAAFGEISYRFGQSFIATGGFRAYDYSRTTQLNSTGAFFGNVSSLSSTEESGTTYRANLSYKPDESKLLYASWAQGFRLGKPQPGLPPALCDRNNDGIVDGTSTSVEQTRFVNSDTVDSTELGGKFGWPEQNLMLSAAIFRAKWDELPINVNPFLTGGCRLVFVANAGAAVSKGIEFEGSVRVTKALRLDLAASYVDARFTRDAPAANVDAGNRLPGSPKVNASLGVQYDFTVAGYKVFARADTLYVGEFYGTPRPASNVRAGDYVKVDLSTRVTVDKFNIDFYVKNLTNRDDFVFRGVRNLGEFFGYRLRPRTIGLQVAYWF